MARGIRNNNPGNLRRSATIWLGQAPLQSDPDFVVFASPVYGLRALARTLLTYQSDHGCGTLREIIERWAPPGENDTAAYVAAVGQACGVSAEQCVDLRDAALMARLVEAIVRHENGVQPYGEGLITQALVLAGLKASPQAA